MLQQKFGLTKVTELCFRVRHIETVRIELSRSLKPFTFYELTAGALKGATICLIIGSGFSFIRPLHLQSTKESLIIVNFGVTRSQRVNKYIFLKEKLNIVLCGSGSC